jgi:cytochrome c oxidase subunit III
LQTNHSQHHHPALAHHFDSLAQQREAASLGMWIFLTTEIMFFGGLFAAYIVYRSSYPEAFAAASNDLDLKLGAINTAVLISSSLTMALAVYFSQVNKRAAVIGSILLTMLLGAVFLVIKAFEYHHKYEVGHIPGPNFHFEGPHGRYAQMFFILYFAMTGLHAFHMIIGFGLLAVLAWQAYKGKFSAEYNSPVEITGLYWHFVDIVWIYLFPLLYLLGRTHSTH